MIVVADTTPINYIIGLGACDFKKGRVRREVPSRELLFKNLLEIVARQHGGDSADIEHLRFLDVLPHAPACR